MFVGGTQATVVQASLQSDSAIVELPRGGDACRAAGGVQAGRASACTARAVLIVSPPVRGTNGTSSTGLAWPPNVEAALSDMRV